MPHPEIGPIRENIGKLVDEANSSWRPTFTQSAHHEQRIELANEVQKLLSEEPIR